MPPCFIVRWFFYTFVAMNKLFDSIASGKCILFLGAGASVTSKHKYLSKELIDYYTEIANIPYDNHGNDIVDFVNKVFSISKYDRNDFDVRISDWLGRKLKAESFHFESISIPWKLIITTNIDTLIEESVAKNKIESSFEFLRNIKEFKHNIHSNTKTKVVKLHGCISDIGEYPILFSTKEFEKNNKFYNQIFSLLNQFSDDVTILFIGYSFSDRFGDLFLNMFQEKLVGRNHYLVSPDIDTSEFYQDYWSSKKITPIKKDYKTFIDDYSKWYDANKDKYNSKSRNRYVLPNNTKINFHLSSQLEYFIVPINDNYSIKDNIDPLKFYLGQEPNYLIIKENLDVVWKEKTKEVKQVLLNKFEEQELDCSIIFLKGSYGTGKSTFSYRLIKELTTESKDIVAFEIIDFDKLNIGLIKSLIENLKEVQKVIIYSDLVDLENNFKRIRELRGELNAEQYQDKSIILLQSIRENRLEAYKNKFKIKDINEIDINCIFNEDELNELISKLAQKSVIELKDEKEKQTIINDILIDKELNNPLTIFLKIIKKGNHSKYIINAYNQFDNEDTKKAFKFTCLLYQYGIKMPVGVLKNLISADYQKFKTEVLQTDGKGVFIQEHITNDKYLMPDLYFKVNHKILAKSFIDNFYKNTNTLFSDFQKIVNSLSSNSYSVKLFVKLIKELRNEKKFDDSKINRLYDLAFKHIGLEKQFLIHYTKNLQFRILNKKDNLIKAIKLLDEYELNEDLKRSYFSRDEYLIHRKACVKIELAKLLYNNNDGYYINEYQEAIELFDIKLSLAPDSIFSYRNYIKALYWYEGISEDEVEKAKNDIKIYRLINKAIANLEENADEIIKLQKRYKKRLNESELLQRIDDLYQDQETRPYSLLMRIEYLNTKGEEIDESIIDEIKMYSFVNEVSEFLMYYYGSRLHYTNNRIEFNNIINNNKSIIEKNKIDYLYFSFIAEIYNRNLKEAFSFQKDIRRIFPSAKLKTSLYFTDYETNEKQVFDGTIIKEGSFYNLKATSHGRSLIARINNKKFDFKKLLNQTLEVHLYFTYTGLWADIIKS
ncbi:hypothetical protein UJ101_01061 [Flavobacteriaceae bacterium UJ101]|nr:hypothetical protein UJ101_01061 [Flavobacteriaceae bacterium UJ101]